MLKRIIGGVLLATGILGLALSFVGVILGEQLIDALERSLQDTFALVYYGLDITHDGLAQTRTVISDANKGIEKVQQTAESAGQSLDDLDPLLAQTTKIIAEDTPNSLDTAQEAIPQLVEVAKTIDQTLKTLSDFKIAQNFLGAYLEFDLGVDYNANQPLDGPILEIGNSIGGISEEFRELAPEFEKTRANLKTIGDDVDTIARDLTAINESIAGFFPLLDRYNNLAGGVQIRMTQTQHIMNEQLKMLKRFIIILAIWLALVQIAPLYLGWELLTRRQ